MMRPFVAAAQSFDHLAEPNLPLYRRHRESLEAEATALFPPPARDVQRFQA